MVFKEFVSFIDNGIKWFQVEFQGNKVEVYVKVILVSREWKIDFLWSDKERNFIFIDFKGSGRGQVEYQEEIFECMVFVFYQYDFICYIFFKSKDFMDVIECI